MYYVYILASKRNGTLYIGVTNNLERRVAEHKLGTVEGFTKRYGVHILVYVESHDDVRTAIQPEKQLKKWNRQWKINLKEKTNPKWIDLSTADAPPASASISITMGGEYGFPHSRE
jgi:putative endonuclease